MILLLDNYDSFVFNLARYIKQLGHNVEVYRSDRITLDEIITMQPSAIVLSPGPCTPNEAGICLSVIESLSGVFPILGICLGHQAIGQSFGAIITRAQVPMHGEAEFVYHQNDALFRNLPTRFKVGRYHSLIVSQHNLPNELVVTSTSKENEIMSLRHKKHATYGLQFHPESILTEHGYDILRNFLAVIK